VAAPKNIFKIKYYHDYISPELAEYLFKQASPVQGNPDLLQVGGNQGLETPEALKFLTDLYESIQDDLNKVLNQRIADRKFIDERVKATSQFNTEMGREISDSNYKTIIGLEDANGRIVIGPKSQNYCKSGGAPIAPIPEYLQGPHVTLFGPPDSAKMAINAMNAYHRKLKGEPAVVEELLKTHTSVPKWGADDEDSKTPLRDSLQDAAVNLTACFEGNLEVTDSKKYELAKDHLSVPIKRFPGLALPCTFLFYKKDPIPLHLYDFALHFYRNWNNPQALAFYVPKLENEEEAAYIHKMISTAERMIKAQHPSYKEGTVRLMIVMENPRAILRTHEIMDALYPYFVGASLGWHDFLGSTARLFKEDSHYRIPVKADPNIVIKYIKASHLMLADVVGSRGGIKVGGMYGILPQDNDIRSPSFQITLLGFFKDVITQLKRELTGFWVAHPDFIRLGLAMVEGWMQYQKGNKAPFETMIKDFLEPQYQKEVFDLIQNKDIEGLDKDDPNYVRSLIVADIKESDYIPNNHPDEVRYNVFQSLQYLTDWLSGNGCVALPAIIRNVPVRVMDDLATAERSRWEVWHELRHKRFKMEDFLKIVFEEMNFIRRDLSDSKKIVQVKWSDDTAKWYPIAMNIMIQLMTDPNPAEFATELLMPFTVASIRNSKDPWAEAQKADPKKFHLSDEVKRFSYYFEICGSLRIAKEMSAMAALDLHKAEKLIKSFSVEEIIEAASFHGNIGESKKSLDAQAAKEQALVFGEGEAIKDELMSLGNDYWKKFGFKFLVPAKGRSGKELLQVLHTRIANSKEQEIENAKEALWQISLKRFNEHPIDNLIEKLESLRQKYNVVGASIAVSANFKTQFIALGTDKKSGKPLTESTAFELASLSKTIASAFAIEYFKNKNISLDTPVNSLFEKTKTHFRLKSSVNSAWANEVTIEHLMSHSALNMHYVNGFKRGEKLNILELLEGKHGYKPVDVINKPGTVFSYSGGGFLVLEHLIESLEQKPIEQMAQEFLRSLGLKHLFFECPADLAHGYFDSHEEVGGGCLLFPAFAAGIFGSSTDMTDFLTHLAKAFNNPRGSQSISHDTAVLMLKGADRGCREFMGCDMGLGVFVAEAGDNKLAIHQGANEGFRAIYIYCFAGPDAGKGFTVLCNADNRGVLFISEVAQEILRHLKIQGINYDFFNSNFDFKGLPQEQIVNLGYKNLIFKAFEPTLPEEIINKGPINPLSQYNLAVGAKILSVSNQRFARAENLISPHDPVFDPELFGKQGKIMDSWESARHNEAGFDYVILELPKSSNINFVSFSTKYHDGNQAECVRLLGKSGDKWEEIVPKTPMTGHSHLELKLNRPSKNMTQLKVEMYPDGGLSRLGVYENLPPQFAKDFSENNKSTRFSEAIPKSKKPLTISYKPDSQELEHNLKKAQRIDYASQAFGGSLVKATNEHYGPAVQVISPFPAIHMFDGLESARSRTPGHFEEVTLKLAKKTKIQEIEMDFTYFVNNNPMYIIIDGQKGGDWVELVPKTKVKAFAANTKVFEIKSSDEFDQIKIRIYPDGGINRIRVR
jgi:allantoicase/malate synthase/CubicO group peptidase (beta-lactamase class C family)